MVVGGSRDPKKVGRRHYRVGKKESQPILRISIRSLVSFRSKNPRRNRNRSKREWACFRPVLPALESCRGWGHYSIGWPDNGGLAGLSRRRLASFRLWLRSSRKGCHHRDVPPKQAGRRHPSYDPGGESRNALDLGPVRLPLCLAHRNAPGPYHILLQCGASRSFLITPAFL